MSESEGLEIIQIFVELVVYASIKCK